LRPACSLGRLPRRLGRRRHAHLRSLRQLVAQRLRPRRQAGQSAARSPDSRATSHRPGHVVSAPRSHEPRRRCRREKLHEPTGLFVYLGGLAVGSRMYFVQEYTWDTMLHRASGYIVIGAAIPVVLASLFEASRFRWAATAAAGIYTCFVITEILLLPLFPAQPRLGPAFFPVTHMVPAKFPILLLAPAFTLDLLWQRTRAWKSWQIALVSGVLFIAILVVAEW